ncbi:hypothetical protein TrST_g6704 [Triparma strigata]|uniref:Uncharacterized protein n=1 Tax=Triparma strigata TaxID=1606541 RepID=A0A9W7E031_9STRA|nr:hypothetical protein TrST_g6704 [Triparma strigata]
MEKFGLDSLRRRGSIVLNQDTLAKTQTVDHFDPGISVINLPIRAIKNIELTKSTAREIGKRYLRTRPEHASLQELGLQYLIDNPDENMTYYEQKRYISPVLRIILNFHGHCYSSAMIHLISNLSDIIYCAICFFSTGGQDIYAGLNTFCGLVNTVLYAALDFGESSES